MKFIFHSIKEVHEVRILTPGKWDGEPWIEADLTTNCHGSTRRSKWRLTAKSWKKAQNDGYLLG